MRSSDFHDLVSGRRRGVGSAALRTALAAAEPLYAAGVWWRNRRYDRREELIHRVGAPVISVGNLTLGGSGKTPMVKRVVRRLRGHGVRVAIVSRGYGAPEDGGPNDEALELEQALPDAPHLQNPDRVAAARAAIDELAAQAIVLDDGFQHRRLARDLDVVLIDASEPFGFGRLFPRGALREPVASLRRADVVCLTRADTVDAAAREKVREVAARHAPGATWCESRMAPAALLSVDDRGEACPEAVLETVRGKRVGLVSGIGNPAAFRRTAESLGVEVGFAREFPDHHAYTGDDVATLSREADASGVDAVLCTHKDLVKLLAPALGDARLWAVGIEARVTVGGEEFDAQIERIARAAAAEDPLESSP